MYDQKLIWLSSLITVGTIASGAIAQTNQSDTSGTQIFSSPAVQIDSQNGNGISATTEFNPVTGEVVGGSLNSSIEIPNAIGTQGDTNQPAEVTLNQVADVLDASLDRSLNNLAAAERQAQIADAGPRRIARRSAVGDGDRVCVNPVFEARKMVERQLAETEKFIEQVDQIEPQNNIW